MIGSSGALVAAQAEPESQTSAPSSPGYYDVGVATRTFDSPLFGADQATTYRLYGSQSFPDAGDYHVWLNGGIAGATETLYGATGDGIPAGSHTLGFDAGDMFFGALQPGTTLSDLGDRLPVRGARLRGRSGRSNWSVFGGRARYAMTLPSTEESRSTLYGGEYLVQVGKNGYGAGLTWVQDPVYADPTRTDSADAIVSGRYFREISPRSRAFGEVMASSSAAISVRLGGNVRFDTGELGASVYSFDESFPLVFPLYRPGETGIQVSGRFEPTWYSDLFGSVNYRTDDQVQDRDMLRGQIGLGLHFSTDLPSIRLSYSHDDVVYGPLVPDEQSLLADRYAAVLSQASTHGHMGFTLEHFENSRGVELDRTQALFRLRRVIGTRSYLDTTGVVQRDERSDFGVTLDSGVDRPLRGPYSYLVGLGAAYLNRSGRESGEGVARLGLSRRISGSGWYIRVEARVPFSIGLERSQLNRQMFALDVGNRFHWNDLSALAAALPGGGSKRGLGEVEGKVFVDGEGYAGLPVLVNGEPRAATRRDGSFRIRGLAGERVSLSLDLRRLPPGYEVVGQVNRDVAVSGSSVPIVDFSVARFATLQGAVLVCDGPRRIALKRGELTLSSGDSSRTVRTTNNGGFLFDRVPPGTYRLDLEPDPEGDTELRDPLPVFRVDLTEDIFGYVLKLDCSPLERDRHPRVRLEPEP